MNLSEKELDTMLESEPYLDDKGFTERVMGRLPRSRRRWRPWVLLGSTAVAGLVGLVILPGGAALAGATAKVLATHPMTGAAPLSAIALLVLAVGGMAIGALDER